MPYYERSASVGGGGEKLSAKKSLRPLIDLG